MLIPRPVKLTALVLLAFLVIAAASLRLRHYRSRGGGTAQPATYEFGEVVQGPPLEHEFTWHNDGPTPLTVQAVIAGFGGSIVAVDSLVPVGGAAKLRVQLDTKRLLGPVNALVKVRYKEQGARGTWFALRGRVVAPIELAPQDEVYFFTYQGEGPEHDVTVINHQRRSLALRQVRCDNPRFRVHTDTLAAGSRYQLAIALDPVTPAGRDSAHITLVTDSPDYPTLVVRALAYVDNLVSAFPRTVDFGPIAYGSIDGQVIGKKVILVQKHRGTGFKVLRTTLDLPYMDVEVIPQQGGFLVNVTIVKARAKPGDIHGTLRIATNDPAVPELVLPVTGKMVS